MEENPSLEGNRRSDQEYPPTPTEPEGSLSCLQEPATGPYPDRDEYSVF
jgi:hypothetical protein